METRLKQIRKAKGLSQQDVADEMGLAQANYNKLENGKTELTLTKMERLAAILGCEPVDLIIDRDIASVATRTVKVVAYVQAGTWAESNDLPEEDQYTVAVPEEPDLARYSLTGVQVRGPSMNLRYPEGTVLVITNAIETQEDIQPGKRYVVKRESADGMFEYTVKTLHRDEDGEFWLVPESSDPRFSQPIKVNGEMNDTISIMGRVRYALMRED